MNNIQKTADYILSGRKHDRNIGLELEHLVYNGEYKTISYPEMSDCLKEAAARFGAELYTEDGNIMGVIADGFSLSLEPGCQLEISIRPEDDLNVIRGIYAAFRSTADEIFAARGYALHTEAVLPFLVSGEKSVDEIGLIPKKRYEVMDRHFLKTGRYGRYMMRGTASAQISVDFETEEDAMLKMRVLSKLSPVLALLTENRSGITQDKKWKPYLLRTQIWNDLDSERCGYIPDSADSGFTVQKYAEYIYTHNSILAKENGSIAETGGSAAAYYGTRELTDPDYLLSMYFPNVRLKKYIEYRAADSMNIDNAAAFAALIKNIVYKNETLTALDTMLAHIKTADIPAAEESIINGGYDAEIYGRPVIGIVEELFGLVLKNADTAEKPLIGKLIPLVLAEKQYADIIRGRETEHIPQAEGIRDYLMHSTAKYHDRVVKTLYIPKLFTERETAVFADIIKTLYGIFDKVIAEYRRSPDLRREFGFSAQLEELMLCSSLYGINIPMARIDLFFDEKTRYFKFCEFNTDGASAMNEDRELNIAFSRSSAYKAFAEKYSLGSFELFDSWVEEALEIYRGCKLETVERPHIAIVDFLEYATINEFYIFKEAFERRGCRVSICDIRNISFSGERCRTEDGSPVDIIYRRAVTSDIMSHPEETKGFIEAFKSGKVCVIGDFRTQAAHNKILYKILHTKRTLALLNAKERRFVKDHIPNTLSLDELYTDENAALRTEVYSNKDRWIIKPEDSYGSKGVFAGVETDSTAEWHKKLEEARHKKYILQEFCTPFRLDNIILLPDRYEWTDTANLTGLFVYNGKFKGIYSRISYEQMISTQYNEMSLPTVIVRYRRKK